jgi:Ca2+-binding RTX toxin-like protein
VTLRVITGHRDTSYTACPGARLYAKLDEIRRGAEGLGLPKVYNPTASRAVLKPGVSSVTYRASLSGQVDWFVDVMDGGGRRVRRLTGHGDRIDAVWDGRADDGAAVSPGFYRAKLWARDGLDGPRARAAWLTSVACSAIGTRDDDLVVGTAGDDIVCGLRGNDVLRGGAGDDLLIGGPGADTTDHSNAGSAVSVDLAAETATGQGSDTLDSIERAIGSASADVLAGDDENNRLSGGGGDDRLMGGAGNDTLAGGDGVDTVTFASSAARVVVDLVNRTASGDGHDALRSIENVVGTFYRDTLLGDAGANALNGLAGADVIRGREENDVIRGGGGDDEIAGGAGNDEVIGGHGADSIIGGTGADRLFGSSGADAFSARDGEADTVDGGDGTDEARADADLDILTSIEATL